MTTVTASASDPSELRRLLQEVRRQLDLLSPGSAIGEHLARIVWELATNVVEHAGVRGNERIHVEIDISLVKVRLPGPPFDSVTRAQCAGARGLDTAAWRVERCGWRWSHRHVDGMNEVWLEER